MLGDKRLIMITGAARSGKSRLAEQLARQFPGQIYFIATLVPQDEEMTERVARHRQGRPSAWVTLEEAMDPARAIMLHDGPGRLFILDCLTLLVTNWLLSSTRNSQQDILQQMKRLAETARRAEAHVLVVTNEVGWGIVPGNALSREYRDIMGQANQVMASWADEVFLMVSGIAVKIKTKRPSEIIKPAE